MKEMKSIIVLTLLLGSFQHLFGQGNRTNPDVYYEMAASEFDLIVRINRDMDEPELRSRIALLQQFDDQIEVDHIRDTTGRITYLKGSGGKNSGSCWSDNFDFLIVAIKDKKWKGCMIADKK